MSKRTAENDQSVFLKKTRSKKAVRAFYAQSRVVSGKNTGTLTHKSPKDYSRKWKLSDYD